MICLHFADHRFSTITIRSRAGCRLITFCSVKLPDFNQATHRSGGFTHQLVAVKYYLNGEKKGLTIEFGSLPTFIFPRFKPNVFLIWISLQPLYLVVFLTLDTRLFDIFNISTGKTTASPLTANQFLRDQTIGQRGFHLIKWSHDCHSKVGP